MRFLKQPNPQTARLREQTLLLVNRISAHLPLFDVMPDSKVLTALTISFTYENALLNFIVGDAIQKLSPRDLVTVDTTHFPSKSTPGSSIDSETGIIKVDMPGFCVLTTEDVGGLRNALTFLRRDSLMRNNILVPEITDFDFIIVSEPFVPTYLIRAITENNVGLAKRMIVNELGFEPPGIGCVKTTNELKRLTEFWFIDKILTNSALSLLSSEGRVIILSTLEQSRHIHEVLRGRYDIELKFGKQRSYILNVDDTYATIAKIVRN